MKSKRANILVRNLETGKEKYMVERIANSKAARAMGWEVVDTAPLPGMKEEVIEEVETPDNGEGTEEDVVETPEDVTPTPKPKAKKPAAKKKTQSKK